VLELFRYALRSGGLLFLGSSENINHSDGDFTLGDKKWKIYTCTKNARHPELKPPILSTLETRRKSPPDASPPPRTYNVSFSNIIEKMLLKTYVPTSVIVNGSGDIVYIHGRTGEFLEPATGHPRLNIIEMAREGLRVELSAALRRVQAEGKPIMHEGIRPTSDGPSLRLSVHRLTEPESIRGLLLVTFQTLPVLKKLKTHKIMDKGKSDSVIALEQELQSTKETLQSTVEELETSNEELKSTNEEMQSTNEELQSLNEELETSKEEMQSLNEELQTVNAQLQAKVEDLGQANDDMQNLLNSTEIATIFLDQKLRIKRFTQEATKLINLIAGDVGRPISHLATNLEYGQLHADAAEVLRTLVSKEREVQTKTGEWRQVHISPYRTMENLIDGLVVTFVDINRVKKAELAASARRDYAESIVATVHEPLVVLDEALRIVSCNEAFLNMFKLNPRKTIGQLIYEVDHWEIPQLRKLLENVLTEKTFFTDFKIKQSSPTDSRTLLLNARCLTREANLPGMILLAMEDISPPPPRGRKSGEGKRDDSASNQP
jgi:two-component system CheB/CheR fusion protein